MTQHMASESPALVVENLSKEFTKRDFTGRIATRHRAVDDVSFTLSRGETLGLVGASGSGKSTTARLVMRLMEPDTGRVSVLDEEWTSMSQRALRPHRKRLQMVFQNPYGSLDPTKTVFKIVRQAIRVGRPGTAVGHADVMEILDQVKLGTDHLHRYPSEFSGGQRQRIALARALATGPEVIVADEAASALDVSTQAQIINLLKDLQEEVGLGILFITHDLAVVRQIADNVAVMEHGRIVERGATEAILDAPETAYVRTLVEAVPKLERD